MVKKFLLFTTAFIALGLATFSQTYLSEDFESSFSGSPGAPSGWTQTKLYTVSTTVGGSLVANGTDGNKEWVRNRWSGSAWDSTSSGTAPTGAQSGVGVLYINDYNWPNTSTPVQSARMISPTIDLSGSSSPYIRYYFFQNQQPGLVLNTRVLVSADGGSTWDVLSPIVSGFTVTNLTWSRITLEIPAAYRTANFKFAFEATNRWGTNSLYIDNVTVEEFTPTTITSAGSGDWNSTSTWSGGVIPTADNHVVIASGHTVTVTNTSSTTGIIGRCQNLTVNGTMNYGSGTSNLLQVYGNVVVNGTLNAFNGTSGRFLYCGGSFTINSGGTANFATGTSNQTTATTSISTGVSGIVFTNNQAASFTNNGTLTNNRILNILHMGQGTFTYNSPVICPRTFGLYLGTVNPNGNLTLGESSVTTTQSIERHLGTFSSDPTFGSGITRSYVYYTPNWSPLTQQNVFTGRELETVSGVKTIRPSATLTLNTQNHVVLSEDLQLSDGSATSATLTLTRGILITRNNKLIWNTTSTTGPSAGTTPSTASPPTTHGSYVVGNFKIRFQTSGTTSRTVPLGIDTNFNSISAPTANRYTPVVFGNTSGWSASNPYPIVSWVGAPSGAVNSPLTTLFTARTLRVNLDGGNDFNATTTIGLNANNYVYGSGTSSDNLSAGDVSQLRLAQSTSLTGSWNARTASSGTGSFVNNTNYNRTTATAAPGPIAPLATYGEYFAWASTVPSLDVAGVSLVSPPSSGCYGTNQTVTVRFRNASTNTLDFSANPVTVGAVVTGAASASFSQLVNSGTLPAGDSMNVTLTTTFDMSATGTYTFTPYAVVTGDGNTANDSVSPKPTRIRTSTVSLPTTLVSFTGYTGSNLSTVFPQWFEGGTDFSPASSETTSPWTSDVFGNTGSNTAVRLNIYSTSRSSSSGWLVGPKFTAGTCTRLTYKLALTTYNTTTASTLDANDTLGVYVSTDCGSTWQLVKLYTQGSSISNTGQSETVDLSSFAGSDIIVAFYGTEGPTASGDDDLFLDDILISESTGVDILADAIVVPTPSGSTPNGNASQQITVRIKNNSCNTHNFTTNPTTITINVSGAASLSRNVTINTGTLAANDTLRVDVGATFAMTTTGTYNFSGFTATTSDVVASNDTFPSITHDVTQAWNVRRETGVSFSSIMSSGTSFTNWIAFTPTNTDDNTSGTVRLFNLTPGFDFQFYGTTVGGFRASTNGWLTFDTTSTSTAFSNDLSSTPNFILAPFWDDLRTNGNPGTALSLDTSMKYQILGSSPNRVLVVEWKGMESYSNPNGTDLNFQIRLYENGDSIQYVYSKMQGFDGSTNFTWSYSLGLKGNNTTVQRQSQQVANSRQFDVTAVNNLSEVPECNSRLTFIPNDNCVGCTASSAAPSNDNAAGAISIPVNSAPCVDLCGTYYSSRNATASPQAVCTANADDDVWFTFTAPNPLEGNIKIDVRGAGGYDPVVEVLDVSFNSLRCRNATSTGLTDTAVVLESNLTPGGTYYVRVYHAAAGSGTDGNFSICVYNQPVPPVNDTVAGAINLTVGTSCSPLSGNTLAATGSKNSSCTGTADDDLWYRFTATSPNIVVEVQSGPGFNAAVQIFDSISSPLSSGDTIARASLACINSTSTGGLETYTSSSLVVGKTYYVRVYHQPSGAATGNFTICAYIPPKALGTITATQQTGDVAQGASAQPVVRYNLPVSGFAGSLTLTNAVVTANNTLNSDIASGGVLLYSTGSTATFTSPTLLGSASFSGSTATFTGLSLDLANGDNYVWIAYNISPTAVDGDSVDAFFNASSLTITASGGATSPGAQPPTALNPVGRRRIFIPNPYDDCSGAKTVNICAAPDTIRNLDRTSQTLPASVGCGGTSDDDVWYKFTPTTAEDLNIIVYSTLDVVVEIREGSACNGTYIDCIDDNFSSGYELGVLTGVTPGTTYFVRVYSWSSSRPTSSAFHWLSVAPDGCWIGDLSSAWGSAGNWSDEVVPNSCAQNVTIPAGTPNAPVISGTNYTAGNVSIAGGVTLTLSGNNLNVCGNWTGGASTNASTIGSGRVILSGTGAQTVSGRTAFDILRVNKTSGTSSLGAGSIVDINSFLELESGNFNVSAGTITFKSPDADNVAMLDNFSSGFTGTITGSIVAERSFNAATDPKLHKQHFFGSPINNVAITQFAPAAGVDGGWVTPKPDCDEMWLQSGSNYGNVFEYDESNVTTCHLEAWKVRSAGNAENGRGYSVVKSGSGKLTLTGATNTGNVSVSGLTRSGWTSMLTPQGNQYESGWSLLGNPYLASVDLDFAANPDFENAVQVLHTSGPFAGTYQPVTMSGSGVLAPFQGFMARKAVTGGTATFTFNSTNRSRTTTTFQKNGEHQMSLTVVGNGFSDITYFNFDANSTTGFDYDVDGGKLSSMLGQPTLYSIIGSTWASINTNPDVQSTPTIPVGFNPGNDGTFQFNGSGFDELPNTTVYLEDKKANVMHNLSAMPEYTFTAVKGDDNERFVLHFNFEAPSGVKPVVENNMKVFSFENNVVVDFSNANTQGEHTIVIYDILGKVISNENFTGKVYTKPLEVSEPMYVVVKANDGNTFVSKKLFVTK